MKYGRLGPFLKHKGMDLRHLRTARNRLAQLTSQSWCSQLLSHLCRKSGKIQLFYCSSREQWLGPSFKHVYSSRLAFRALKKKFLPVANTLNNDREVIKMNDRAISWESWFARRTVIRRRWTNCLLRGKLLVLEVKAFHIIQSARLGHETSRLVFLHHQNNRFFQEYVESGSKKISLLSLGNQAGQCRSHGPDHPV
jgi:hypothetical protein